MKHKAHIAAFLLQMTALSLGVFFMGLFAVLYFNDRKAPWTWITSLKFLLGAIPGGFLAGFSAKALTDRLLPASRIPLTGQEFKDSLTTAERRSLFWGACLGFCLVLLISFSPWQLSYRISILFGTSMFALLTGFLLKRRNGRK